MSACHPVQQEGVELPLVDVVEDPLGQGGAEVVEEGGELGEEPCVEQTDLFDPPPTGRATRPRPHT